MDILSNEKPFFNAVIHNDIVDAKILKSEINGKISAPPSKSYTHRAFFSASLSGKSEIKNPLVSDDTVATLNSCKKIGADFLRKSKSFYFYGTDFIRNGFFDARNSGTTLRILLSLLSLNPRGSIVDGDKSLRSRPNLELAIALKKLGAKLWGFEDYRAPIFVRGRIYAGKLEISGRSSQFVTSLLFALPLLERESIIKVREIKSRPYLDITLDVLEKAGVNVEIEENSFYVYPSEFSLRRFEVPPDYSSMSYLISAGILAGRVEIDNAVESKQGDMVFIDAVREMGGRVKRKGRKLIAEKSELEGIEFDAGNTPDIVPTLAVLGAVAKGEMRIYNAEHLRLKETDRIKTTAINLRRLGIEVKETEDGLIVRGGEIRNGVVESFGDHRIAMAFSLLGLIGEVTVRNAECVSVSYPNYFEDLRKIGARVEIL